MPRLTSSFTITAARFSDSSLLCASLPEESVWPETSNLKFCTPAPLSRFLASMSALPRFCSFLSQFLSNWSESVLKVHWFLRPSSMRRLFTDVSSFLVAAPPATFLATSQGACASKRATRTKVMAAHHRLGADGFQGAAGPRAPMVRRWCADGAPTLAPRDRLVGESS